MMLRPTRRPLLSRAKRAFPKRDDPNHARLVTVKQQKISGGSERVGVVGEIESVIEEDDPCANDLFRSATALLLDPFAASWVSDACEQKRNDRCDIERGGSRVRETHNSLVASLSALLQSFGV